MTASRTQVTPFDSPMAVTVVGPQEIQERAVRTPAEALRFKPGIWVQKTGHLGGAPILRGFMGNRVIYLFDGIRRNTAGLFKGPNSFLQNIDALDVDRIEVIRGPGSVLFGSDAIGGVVNVITNEQPRFPGALQAGSRTYGRYASVDQELSWRQELSLASPNLYAFAGGTLRDIDDLRGGRGVGIQSPSGWREGNWDAQIDWLVGRGNRLEFFVQDFSRPKGRRFDRPNWKQENDRELYAFRYFGKDLWFVQDLKVTGYFHDQRGFIDERFWDSDTDDKTWGGEIQATSYPLEELRLVYGFHYHQDEVRKSNPQGGTEDPQVDWFNPAGFVLAEWQIFDRLRLDLGGRWDRFTLESDAPPFEKLEGAVQDAIKNGAFSRSDLELEETDDAFTGGVGAVFSLTEHLNLVGHVGRAFRAPNKSDMLSFGQFTFGFNVPSTELRPESSWTYEVGLKADYPDFAGSATGFYTVLQDAIVSRPGKFAGADFIDVNGNGVEDADERVFVKRNAKRDIIAYGVELEAYWYVPRDWTRSVLGEWPLSLFGNFTWVFGKDRDAGEPLDRAFPANGLVGIRIENSRNPARRWWWIAFETWMVDAFDRIPSSRLNRDPAFRVNPQDRNSPLLRANGSVPGFTIFNVRGGVRIAEHATVTIGVENITDRKYRVKDSRIDGPGLSFVAALDLRF